MTVASFRQTLNSPEHSLCVDEVLAGQVQKMPQAWLSSQLQSMTTQRCNRSLTKRSDSGDLDSFGIRFS